MAHLLRIAVLLVPCIIYWKLHDSEEDPSETEQGQSFDGLGRSKPMRWMRDIQRHLEQNAKAKVLTSVVSNNRTLLNYWAADQSFVVTIDVVESSPIGGQCLSIQTQSGSGVLLESLLESFDGLFI